MIQRNLKKEILDLLQDEFYITSWSSSVESPAVRYCHSIKILLSREKPDFFRKFIQAYVCLLKGKSIPVFKISTVLVVYKKWLIYPEIVKEIKYISSKVKTKSTDLDFWHQFILNTAADKVNPELQTARLNLLICLFTSKTFKVEDCSKYGIVVNTILKLNIHQGDFLFLKCQLTQLDHPYYRMFFLIRRYIDLKIPGLELAEMIKIHFSTPDRSLKYSKQICEFYLSLEVKLPSDYSLQLSKMEIGKLYHIYKLCPRLFEIVEVEIESDLNLDSLIQNLFRDYMFSGVLLRAYISCQINSTEMTWFNDELSGKNIVFSENLPFTITKKVAHHFRCLPFTMDISVTRALIYSAIYTSGTDEQFALVVARSIRLLDQATFWIDSMIQLYKNGLRSVEVREVMDYLYEKVIVQGQEISLKNKSVRNLMLEIDQWHEQLRRNKVFKLLVSKKMVESEIGLYFTDYEGQLYMIKQIVRTDELFYEGKYLQHCVYTYRNYCMTGKTFIFSLRKIDEKADEFPLITIEVVSNEVRQLKGKCNRLPSEKENAIIRSWAQEKQLKIAC